MPEVLTRLARLALRQLPKGRFGYRAARAYLNWFRGENNHLRQSNGEDSLLEWLLPHCKVVFDVGANVGDWAAVALSIKPALDLTCFEPTNSSFAALRDRALRGAKLERLALSDHRGEANLTIFGERSAINSIVCHEENSWGRPQGTEVVQVETVDGYMVSHGLDHVDFVKLDVEGAEMLVLRGMEEALRKGCIDAIQFEYGRFSIYARVFLRDLFSFFQDREFHLFKLVQRELHQFERYHDELESFEYQNWLAVRTASPLGRLALERSRPGILCPP